MSLHVKRQVVLGWPSWCKGETAGTDTRLCRSFRNDAAVSIFHMSYKAAATAPPKSEQLTAMLSNTISR